MTTRRALLLAASALPLAARARGPRMQAVPAGASVLALGDSLTYGAGASPDASYPAVLARLTGWNVANAGIRGETSAGTLARLPGLLRAPSPRLVILSIGANDFLRHLPVQDTRANIRAIVRQAQAAGAQVLLVAVPEFRVVANVAQALGDHTLYADLARELKVPVHAGGWSGVLSDAALRSDTIHPNARGYELFAQGLFKTARKVGLVPA